MPRGTSRPEGNAMRLGGETFVDNLKSSISDVIVVKRNWLCSSVYYAANNREMTDTGLWSLRRNNSRLDMV